MFFKFSTHIVNRLKNTILYVSQIIMLTFNVIVDGFIQLSW